MTDTSRRTLLRVGAFGALLAPLASVRTAFAAATTALYTRSRFTPLLNKAFTLVDTSGSWSVVLTQVSDLAHAAKGDNKRFGLTFRASVAGPPQGTYTLKRGGFTSTTLFVVPSDAGRRTYQAIVNAS